MRIMFNSVCKTWKNINYDFKNDIFACCDLRFIKFAHVLSLCNDILGYKEFLFLILKVFTA